MIKCIAKFCISGIFLVAFAYSGYAQTPPDIVGIEEDWEMLIKIPEPTKGSPQVQTWMSPTDLLDKEHFGVDFNHVKRSSSGSGGFQTKAMNGEILIDKYWNERTETLWHEDETIEWTQRMILLDDQLFFEVIGGISQTWGSFGGPNTRVRIYGPQTTNLNNYNPIKSLEWSGVGYAANRVEYLRLKTVRCYTSDGNVYTTSINKKTQ